MLAQTKLSLLLSHGSRCLLIAHAAPLEGPDVSLVG